MTTAPDERLAAAAPEFAVPLASDRSSLSTGEDPPLLSVVSSDEGECLRFSGPLTVHSLSAVEERTREAARNARAAVTVDVSSVTRLDTAGALLINLLADGIRERGIACAVAGCGPELRRLLETARPGARNGRGQAKAPLFLRLPNAVGLAFCRNMNFLGRLIGFMGHFLLVSAGMLLRPGRIRWTPLVFHMEQAGIRAVPIVALLTFLIGMVVAYMGAEQLSRFAGAQKFAVKLLEVTVLREMAVLITAIVVAGRSSASFTAQIGAMVANGEVDAMLSMGLDPNALLVAPRVFALMICLPMLVLAADLAALAGGAVALWYGMDMNSAVFVSELNAVSELRNFAVGLAKTPFFAIVIGLVGCFQGFQATANAESVGHLTTVSVVQAIFLIILLDAVFAIFFTTLGM
jgi:phospholipid/cholesterol/gamma-HCH transport system permease protein